MSQLAEQVGEHIRHARTINDLLYILSLEQQKGESVNLHDETKIEALAMIDDHLTKAHRLMTGEATSNTHL